MNEMRKINLKEVGEVPAQKANEFKFGEVIVLDYGYTLKVIEVKSSIDGSKVRMFVQHVPEEDEYFDGESFHHVEYESGQFLGIADRHGNEGLC